MEHSFHKIDGTANLPQSPQRDPQFQIDFRAEQHEIFLQGQSDRQIGRNKVSKELQISFTNQQSQAQIESEGIFQRLESYKPKTDIIKMETLKQSRKLKLKKYKQAVYYGEIVNNKRHGKGIMIYENKRLYQGEWETDCKHGRGYQEFPTGTVYEGFYINNKPQGIGRFSWPNGEFYEGEWENGLKHGSGMWKGAKGDSYLGEWKFGKADGNGVHLWVNGDRYQGYFKESLKHGEGVESFASGDQYRGRYSYGKANGYGEYFWKNGSFYKGSFKNGLRNGNGIWKKGPGNSDRYEGQYFNDKKQGYGIFSWTAGNVYKGNYRNDQRNDHGEMYWNNGSYYKGQWENGVQHGQGQLYIPEEGLKKGQFYNNQLVNLEIELQPARPETPIQINQRLKSHSNMHQEVTIETTSKQKIRSAIKSRPHIRYQQERFQRKRKISQQIQGSIGPESIYAPKFNEKLYKNKKIEHFQKEPLQAERHLPKFQRAIEHNLRRNKINELRQRILSKQRRTIESGKPCHATQQTRILHSSLYMHKKKGETRPQTRVSGQKQKTESLQRKHRTLNVEYGRNRRYEKDMFMKRIQMLTKEKSLSIQNQSISFKENDRL